MCGITGIYAFNLIGKFNRIHVTAATLSLEKRGPDTQDVMLDEWVALGHRRLSIIDTSDAGDQPMWDPSGRYCIVFNGEVFNYKELREQLIQKGVAFRSHSDTEVLLQMYMREKEDCLSKLNGFFAFCVFDKQEQSLFLARDRYGIKPLYYLYDEDKFIFASEMKAMLQYGIDREIDHTALLTYLQLNYIPAPHTIFKSVRKLMPGHCLFISRQSLENRCYYELPGGSQDKGEKGKIKDYDEARHRLRKLLDESVQRRLVADVPLGAFLSGGLDSSIITGLASIYKKDLHTFSIGFRDEKYFDETSYAKLVAEHFQTRHTVFSLSNDDLYAHLDDILDYIDEPFADSSGIAVYILSKETRKHVTVALSGDGADELLGGYTKHEALLRSLHPGWKEALVTSLYPLLKYLPQSRNDALSNTVRQVIRFGEGARMPLDERYWRWAAFASEDGAMNLLSQSTRERVQLDVYRDLKNTYVADLRSHADVNQLLRTDVKLVLANDMLTKVDMMSMANSLEVRVPFLDVEVVHFILSLPAAYKRDAREGKRILRDTFRDFLPAAVTTRSKKGFEVPLLKWFRTGLRSRIENELLSDSFVRDQGIFDVGAVRQLRRRLFSRNPGDVHARIWGLLVFQHWWKKFMTGG